MAAAAIRLCVLDIGRVYNKARPWREWTAHSVVGQFEL